MSTAGPRLSIPTTWQRDVLDLVRAHNVFTVYGALDRDPVGGGKPGDYLPRVSREQLARHVADVKRAGSSFTYVLNSSCLGNREFSSTGHADIVRFLGFLSEIGVDYVTVALPQLIEMVRRHAPGLKVRVSTIAFVDSPQRARFFEELGAHEITLDFNINRDFRRLRAIRKAVSLELALIVNDFCLLRCPWVSFHYNAIGHAGDDPRGVPFVDNYSLSCKSRQLERPVEMLRAPWIRPEDVARYERIGIDNFKIAGRGKPASYIHRVVGAYGARRWDGNLLDLLEAVIERNDDTSIRALDEMLRRAPRLTSLALRVGGALLSRLDKDGTGKRVAYLGGLSPEVARRLIAAFHAMGAAMGRVFIDNRQLDGFLDRFEKASCADCEGCSWCDEWAEKAIRTDPARSAEAVKRAAEALQWLIERGS